MNKVDQAVMTQLANIQKKTGKTLEELTALIGSYGPLKHTEVVGRLKDELGLGHGDANTLAHTARKTAGPAASGAEGAADVLDGIYAGPKAALRPIHDRLIAAIGGFGAYETAPKKGYVSLRRSKQFAMVGPATNTRVEVGLNMRGRPGTDRLQEQAPGGMCTHKVKLASAEEVDAELVGWVREAYDAAG